MIGKIMGAILIVTGCGGFGFTLTATHRKEENGLRQLVSLLDYMQCELQYRLTPLPDLCRQVGNTDRNQISRFFGILADELDREVLADVQSCFHASMGQITPLPTKTANALEILGNTLGRFDVEGQIRDLEGVREYCRVELKAMAENKENRLRCYQTLSICAGAALAILFV